MAVHNTSYNLRLIFELTQMFANPISDIWRWTLPISIVFIQNLRESFKKVFSFDIFVSKQTQVMKCNKKCNTSLEHFVLLFDLLFALFLDEYILIYFFFVFDLCLK